MKKKIVIAGGTGFIGKSLEKYFSEKGDYVIILTRKIKNANHIYWDGKNIGPWIEYLNDADVLINLCGKSVDCRYTQKNKSDILNSRTYPTQLLNEAMLQISKPPKVWMNASSATIYVDSTKVVMTEEGGIIGNDFSMNVCKQWEHVFYKNPIKDVRKVSLRMAIVLGEKEGAFPKYKQITKIGLGGPQADGRQLMSWIHIDDVCRSIQFINDNENIVGAVNITAPNIVENREFMKLLRQAMGRSFGLRQPKLLLEIGALFLRTETELLLKSRNVFPEKLIKNGFVFKYPELKQAIEILIGNLDNKTRKLKTLTITG